MGRRRAWRPSDFQVKAAVRAGVEQAKRELGWHAKWTLDAGLKQTFDWFVAARGKGGWLEKVMTPEYQAYYKQQYEAR